MHLVPMMVNKLWGLFSPQIREQRAGAIKKTQSQASLPAICYTIYKATQFWETKVEIEENTQE